MGTNKVMGNVIDRVVENPDINVKVEWMTPSEVDEFLETEEWRIVQEYLAESRGDWNYTEYQHNYYPNIKLTMEWNGWTGQVELVATHIEEEDPLMRGLREVLVTVHHVVAYQNYDFIEVNKFIESQDWELCRATATILHGWCHYIYRNARYPDRKLVLAWEPEFNIIELRTVFNDEMEDK